MSDTKKRISTKKVDYALRGLKSIGTKRSDYIEVLTQLHYENPTSISSAKFDAILIKTISKEFSGIDADIIRMALGILLGYERKIKIGKREEKYLRNSNYIKEFYYDNQGNYDEVDTAQQKKYRDSLINAENYRIKQLAEILSEKIEKNDFDNFIQNLKKYYDDDGDKAILPQPSYIQNKDAIEVSINIPIDSKNKKKKCAVLNFLKELLIGLFREWIKKKVNVIVTLIFIALIVAFNFLKLKANDIKNISINGTLKITISEDITSSAPPVADDALANAVSFKDETAPDVESFSIREKEFSLYPGYSKKLSIEQIYPSNADVSSISYELVPPGLLEIENGLITALDDVPRGRTVVKIILKAKDCKETVYVMIENPNEEDEIFQGGPLFEQSQ